MSNRYQLEFLLGISEHLYEHASEGNVEAIPDDIVRFFRRGQGTVFSQMNGSRWYLVRNWFDLEQYIVKAPYYGDRAKFEADRDNEVITWANGMFTKYYWPADQDGHGIRPAAAFWYNNGMQYGTRYHEFLGPDIETDDPLWLPEYPYDFQRLKTYMPDWVNPDDPEDVRDIVWDVPEITNTHQCSESLSTEPTAKRRWYQATSNAKLDYSAFGLDGSWKPPAEVRRARRDRIRELGE